MSNDAIQRAENVIKEFMALVTPNTGQAQLFLEHTLNARSLLELIKRLRSASQYLDCMKYNYGTPRVADCSASSERNNLYLEDSLQIIHHDNPYGIILADGTGRKSILDIWNRKAEVYLEYLDMTKRYYQPVFHPRFLEVEGDVE
jgi:hypothetical protein